MKAASLSLLALVTLTTDEIIAACALLILMVVAIWVRSRNTKLK